MHFIYLFIFLTYLLIYFSVPARGFSSSSLRFSGLTSFPLNSRINSSKRTPSWSLVRKQGDTRYNSGSALNRRRWKMRFRSAFFFYPPFMSACRNKTASLQPARPFKPRPQMPLWSFLSSECRETRRRTPLRGKAHKHTLFFLGIKNVRIKCLHVRIKAWDTRSLTSGSEH